MWDYSQPDFFKFGDDSLFLVEKTQEYLKSNQKLNIESCLDLGSGCGVIGLELVSKIPTITNLTSIEKQEEFSAHLKSNSSHIQKSSNFEHLIMISDFREADLEGKFDLIVANPPYFSEEEGRPSPNKYKNECRFFINGEFEDWLSFVDIHLSENGIFLFLSRKELAYKCLGSTNGASVFVYSRLNKNTL